ncbi:MAG: hypothetical protein ACRC41_13200 [Sarcina sp.]
MEKLINVLEENEFIIIISNSENNFKISYEFDLVEIDAAKSFASTDEEEYTIAFADYLKEIAYDNLLDIIDEFEDDYNQHVSIECLNYQDGKWIFNLKM